MRQNGFSWIESEARYKNIIGNREIEPDNVVICPLGIDTSHYNIRKYDFKKDFAKISSINNSKVVMYAGRLIEMKGIKNLLEAEKIYNKKDDVQTIVLGGGELASYVENIARTRKNVKYLGYKEQKEMPFYLNFIAEYGGVFTVPSSSEGMSLVYLEAMACGARVLASCKKDMSEMDFMQTPFARFTTFGNIEELAATITDMLSEKPLTRKIIRHNMKKYNLSNFKKRVFDLYEEYCSPREETLQNQASFL
jgi:glycosyltransferase involved in cell wall biosynthesis